ncbi:MAG TPA: hypothetical protein VIL36_06785 [Acidimicrobiales bacterium]
MAIDGARRALALAEEAVARLDIDAAVAHLSAAVRGFTAGGDPRPACRACLRLGDVLALGMGNVTAGRAWYARAVRLVADEPPCLEQGWAAVAAMGCDVEDPDELLAAAELALDRARRFGDVDLEAKALADAGLAHVQSGRVAEGMALLDEAMALVCGPADQPDAAGKSVCSFFTACYHAADFERAGSWADLLRRHGLIGPAPGAPVYLSSHCDTVQAALLFELGRWTDAEAVLTRARADFQAAMGGTPAWHPEIALADLRVHQGRLAEAEVLLLGKDQAVQAMLPAARLHLARGDVDLAPAAARRGLRGLRADRLRAAELLMVVVDAELAAGDLVAAERAADDLASRLAGLDVPALTGRAAAARARVREAAGDPAGAVEVLETAVDGLDPGQVPWRRATLLVALARARAAAGDAAGAAVDAKAAAAALARLDVVVPPGDAEVLARLGTNGGTGGAGVDAAAAATAGDSGDGTGDTAAEPTTAVLRRDGKWWVASAGGTTVRLPATKGLGYLAELVARPGVERHALDLVDAVEGLDPDGVVDRRRLGDAGGALDARARRAYRHRIEELRGEAADHLAAGRLEAAERAQAEVDALVRELARAFGLGGRDRRAASAAERARLNVTRAVRAATARLAEALPGPGAALDRHVRTGRYCAYEPVAGDVRWIVQSAPNGTAAD